MDTLNRLIRRLHESLDPLYGEGESQWLIRTIFEHIKGWNQVDLLLRGDKQVSDFTEERVLDVVERLKNFEPIQYIFGESNWHGLKIKVSPAVLIPRPETSQLVDIIADENTQSDLRVLDLCSGSGCIAVALAKQLKFPTVEAIDISEEALEIARKNASENKVEVQFSQKDLFALAPEDDPYDIIVSNPPYIMEKEKGEMSRNVLEYEPIIALFVPDDDPIKYYRAISEYSLQSLKASGKLYFEINPLTADQVEEMMKSQGWKDVTVMVDMYGRKRFLKGEK